MARGSSAKPVIGLRIRHPNRDALWLRSFSDTESHDNRPAAPEFLAPRRSYSLNKDRISLLFIIVFTVVYPIISPSTPTGLPDPQHINQSIHSPMCLLGCVECIVSFSKHPLIGVINIFLA